MVPSRRLFFFPLFSSTLRAPIAVLIAGCMADRSTGSSRQAVLPSHERHTRTRRPYAVGTWVDDSLPRVWIRPVRRARQVVTAQDKCAACADEPRALAVPGYHLPLPLSMEHGEPGRNGLVYGMRTWAASSMINRAHSSQRGPWARYPGPILG